MVLTECTISYFLCNSNFSLLQYSNTPGNHEWEYGCKSPLLGGKLMPRPPGVVVYFFHVPYLLLLSLPIT